MEKEIEVNQNEQMRPGQEVKVTFDRGVGAYQLFLDSEGSIVADGQNWVWVRGGGIVVLGKGRNYKVVGLDTTSAPFLSQCVGEGGIAVKPVSSEPGKVFVIPQNQLNKISINPT